MLDVDLRVVVLLAAMAGVIGLAGVFTINARRLMRDMRQKLETFRTRLEQDATSIVDELFDGRQTRE